jgi:BirA family transcriptional regulator, biotin operon repressor / biotin---[acetyl-CoA-carboxylase] ligase
MSWDAKLLHRHLTTRRFGREAIWLDEVDSTNRWIAEHVNDFTISGGVVIADHQTAGRGRYDRRWSDAAGKSLLFSLLIRHDVRNGASQWLSMLPGIAVAETLTRRIGSVCKIGLKWPNDVLLNGLKVSGVLGQTVWQETRCWVILGVGLNVDGERDDFPPEIRAAATSVWNESGERIPREILLAEILNEWELLLDRFYEENFVMIRERWELHSPARGTRIQRREMAEVVSGAFEGLGESGELLLRDDRGTLHRLLTGDLTV